MSDTLKFDEEIFDPRDGLRKSLSFQPFNCHDESVLISSSSTIVPKKDFKLRSKLSLSHRKAPNTKISAFKLQHKCKPTKPERKLELYFKTDDEDTVTADQSHQSFKRSRIDQVSTCGDLSPSSSNSSDEAHSKMIISLSENCPSESPQSYFAPSFYSVLNKDPDRSETALFQKSPYLSSEVHRNMYKDFLSDDEREKTNASSLNNPLEEISKNSFDESTGFSKHLRDNMTLNSEQLFPQQRPIISIDTCNKSVFKTWIESYQSSLIGIKNSNDETQSLPTESTEEKDTDSCISNISAPTLADKSVDVTDCETNILLGNSRACIPMLTPTTSPSSNRSSRYCELFRPSLIQNHFSPIKTSSSNRKQTTITKFFAKTEEREDRIDKTQDQVSLNSSPKEQTDDSIKVFRQNETLFVEAFPEDATTSSSRFQLEAKQKWSLIMSQMKTRGTSNNLQRDIFQNEKPKLARQTKPARQLKLAVKNKPFSVSEDNLERKCPFYKLIPGTGFAIDAFCYGRVKGVTSYFLSHFHYDHYRGLGKWLDKPLYCSQITANLVNLKIKPNPNLVRVLPLHESRLIDSVEVILIDANHCPGSVMFLFRFVTGRTVLHVGDFRAHSDMENLKELNGCQIDHLYLDTTYLDENYSLPAQEEVLAYVTRLVRQYIKKFQKLLIVSGTYTIGKEKVFMAAAEELNCKIWAPTEKRKIFSCLDDNSIMSRLAKDPSEARVHVVNMGDIKPSHLKSYLDKLNGTFSHILALNPTGWEYDAQKAPKGLDSIPPRVYHGTIFIHGIPYSEHSGFSEMERFVRYFKPRKIIPTVNIGSAAQRQKMGAIFTKWLNCSALL